MPLPSARSSPLPWSSIASRAIQSLYPCGRRHRSSSWRLRSGWRAAGASACDHICIGALAFSTEMATCTTESSPLRYTLWAFRPPLFPLLLLPSKRRPTLSPGAGNCLTRSRHTHSLTSGPNSVASRGALAFSHACASRQHQARRDARPLSGRHRAWSQSGSACPRGAECTREARRSLRQPIFPCFGRASRLCGRRLLRCGWRSPGVWFWPRLVMVVNELMTVGRRHNRIDELVGLFCVRVCI